MDYTYIFNMGDHVAELIKTGHPTRHVQGRTVYSDDRVKVLFFPFKAGQALKEHTAPYPAVLHFLEGKAEVTVGDDIREACAGTWIHIPANLPHSIRARTAVVMQLLIFRGHLSDCETAHDCEVYMKMNQV